VNESLYADFLRDVSAEDLRLRFSGQLLGLVRLKDELGSDMKRAVLELG
jgi:hypothetical protein